MHLRDMRRTDWTRITKRRYISREYVTGSRRAYESLILLDEITAPLIVDSAGTPVKIVEKDYAWLQIAEEGQRWWLTSMFDEKGKLLQLYFDITAGNLFDEGDNPRFRDMYLDIVMNLDGAICVLDETELAEALSRSKITPSEYTQTKQACEALQQLLTQHTDKVLAHCNAAYTRLMKLSSTNQGGF